MKREESKHSVRIVYFILIFMDYNNKCKEVTHMMWDFDFIEEFKNNWNEKVKKWKIIYIVLSIIMILVGIACLFYPIQTFEIMKIIVGIVMIEFGLYSIMNYCLSTSFFKDPFAVVYGIINILFGILIIAMPSMITALSLTFMLAIILLFYGTQKISFAQKLKYFRITNTGIYTFSGVVNIIVSIISFILPLTSALAINYIIAFYLIVDGVTLFIEAINLKKID